MKYSFIHGINFLKPEVVSITNKGLVHTVLRRENLKTEQSVVILHLCFRKPRAEKYQVCRNVI